MDEWMIDGWMDERRNEWISEIRKNNWCLEGSLLVCSFHPWAPRTEDGAWHRGGTDTCYIRVMDSNTRLLCYTFF